MPNIKRMFDDAKASINITGVVVDVVLVTALIPVIVTFINNAENLTATETTLLGLTTLFIVISLTKGNALLTKIGAGFQYRQAVRPHSQISLKKLIDCGSNPGNTAQVC